MRILLADNFDSSSVERLRELGCDVRCEPRLGPHTLVEAVTGVDVLVVRSTKVPAAVIATADALRCIVRAGAGYDNIDVTAAAAAGVRVCNCPGMNAIAVAELAFGLLICCDRRLAEQTAQFRQGRWRKKEYIRARGLKGMTLGVVGVGSIGEALIQRARAFDISIFVWSRSMTVDRAAELGATHGGRDRASLLRMLGECDAVSIHVAATDETQGMCDREFFAAMNDGAFFINTARGALVDESALRDAVQSKGLRCGLDVYQGQPPVPEAEWKSPLADLPGATFTHHIGASTDQAQRAVSEEVVRIIRVFMETGHFSNCVNEDELAQATSPDRPVPHQRG
ncbi:MAG: hydroxyacid dehydrogenase [Planctomycetes bacterium]|nr:hydroxyacid dehydrogenase [Planctomycetota bacterium]